MLPEIELDVLKWLDRDALEGLQMHSRYLRAVVDRHARVFPLRYIHDVSMENGDITIQQLRDGREVIEVKAPGEQDLPTFFHRVNNAFVHRLDLSYFREDLHLPFSLPENSSNLQCRVEVLGILHDERKRARIEIDYALVGCLVSHFKPKVYESTMIGDLHEDYAVLFAHDTMRGTVNHSICHLIGAPAPDCIIRELFGVDVLQTFVITTEVNPRPWIGKFIRKFEAAERGTDTIRSVTLLHKRFDKPSPLRLTTDPFGCRRRTDVPTPHAPFIREWVRTAPLYGRSIAESAVSALFVFENAKAAKKLEVFEWTLEEVRNGTLASVHYAFLLNVVGM